MKETIIAFNVKNDISAVNRELEAVSCGDYILFADGEDDVSLSDLQEMIAVLEQCERHGAVCPCASTDGEKNLKVPTEHLPIYQVIPYANTFPILFKAQLFVKFGLLDPSYDSMVYSLAEFCMRFNQYGWNCVRANHVRTSCGMMINGAENDILIKKYPYIEKNDVLPEEYAAEHFAGLLCESGRRKKKILFSLYEVPAVYNGTSNYAMKLLNSFFAMFHEKYDISILAFPDAVSFHGLAENYENVYTPDTVLGEIFDLGYSVSQIYSFAHLAILNRCCLKTGACMLDIIGLRSRYLLSKAPERFYAFRDAVRHADLLLSISRFSVEDIKAFFKDDIAAKETETGYVYLATDKKAGPDQKQYKIPFEKEAYYLVIGNPFRHKFTDETIEAVCRMEEKFIVVGTKAEGYCSDRKNIYGYVSGWLENGMLDYLIKHAKGIIFPSVYEGFGLTVFDALVYNKRILVSDIEVNRELIVSFDPDGEFILTYNTVSELKHYIQTCDTLPERKTAVSLRDWNDAAAELEQYFDRVLQKDIHWERLEERWKYFQIYNFFPDHGRQSKLNSRKGLMIQKCIRRFPGLYKIFRKVMVKIDKGRYGNG